MQCRAIFQAQWNLLGEWGFVLTYFWQMYKIYSSQSFVQGWCSCITHLPDESNPYLQIQSEVVYDRNQVSVLGTETKGRNFFSRNRNFFNSNFSHVFPLPWNISFYKLEKKQIFKSYLKIFNIWQYIWF